MIVLGIETSCDDTAVALYGSEKLIAHLVNNQINLHRQFGGVVPELASRDHSHQLLPLVQRILEQTNISYQQLHAIAVTSGPGLAGPLLAGTAFASGLSSSLKIPVLGIHHLEGHLLAPMLEDNPPSFPFIALLVSGGHTQLVDVQGLGKYTILGSSVDDAAGEAFDKVAKLLGLPYPGGPAIEKLALEGKPSIKLTKPMINRPGLDFSFSGLKTQVLKAWQETDQSEQSKADIACSFQATAIDTLTIKCRRALEQTGYKTLVIAGGVSANKSLQSALKNLAQKLNCEVYYPRHEFCTDNAAMIAYAGYLRFKNELYDHEHIQIKPRWSLC